MSEKFEPKNQVVEKNPKKEYEDTKEYLESKKQAMRNLNRHSGSLGSARNTVGRQMSRLYNRLEEIKGETKVEATELNQKYDELIDTAMKALKDLRDFEIDELGMKEEDAIVGNIDEHRGVDGVDESK